MVPFESLTLAKNLSKIFTKGSSLANNIKDGDEAQRNQKKALFITLVGQATFAKLKDLASPHDIVDLSLGDIMEFLKTHYRP